MSKYNTSRPCHNSPVHLSLFLLADVTRAEQSHIAQARSSRHAPASTPHRCRKYRKAPDLTKYHCRAASRPAHQPQRLCFPCNGNARGHAARLPQAGAVAEPRVLIMTQMANSSPHLLTTTDSFQDYDGRSEDRAHHAKSQHPTSNCLAGHFWARPPARAGRQGLALRIDPTRSTAPRLTSRERASFPAYRAALWQSTERDGTRPGPTGP